MVGTKPKMGERRGQELATSGRVLACSQGFVRYSLPVASPLTSARWVQDEFMATSNLKYLLLIIY